LECAGNTATKCVAKGNRRLSLLLIIAGYFVRAAANFLFPGREMSTSEPRIFLDFRLFVAQNGHRSRVGECPISGAQQTSNRRAICLVVMGQPARNQRL
jgi:hypothetical protein